MLQVTVDLPTGRTIQLPVSEATRNAHVSAYVSALLGCTPDSVRLWHAVDGSLCMAGDASTAMPCTRFSVTQSNAAGGLHGGLRCALCVHVCIHATGVPAWLRRWTCACVLLLCQRVALLSVC